MTHPWNRSASPGYSADLEHLVELFRAPHQASKIAASGDWASALDLWIADELRSAGFPSDEVWPRASLPTVLPREVAMLLSKAKPGLRAELERLILATSSVAPRDARILGKAYLKQVDVVMSQWSRGPEILVSTKTMMSSFRKNLPNRFEEAYGDAANLRGRYPLASIGFVFAMRASVLAEPGTLQRAIDMLRKLRDPSTYDATALVLVDFVEDPDDLDLPAILEHEVPEDLKTGAFFEALIDRVLDASPVDIHVEVRENKLDATLALDEVVD